MIPRDVAELLDELDGYALDISDGAYRGYAETRTALRTALTRAFGERVLRGTTLADLDAFAMKQAAGMANYRPPWEREPALECMRCAPTHTVIYINGEPECGMCHEKQHLRVRER